MSRVLFFDFLCFDVTEAGDAMRCDAKRCDAMSLVSVSEEAMNA